MACLGVTLLFDLYGVATSAASQTRMHPRIYVNPVFSKLFRSSFTIVALCKAAAALHAILTKVAVVRHPTLDVVP